MYFFPTSATSTVKSQTDTDPPRAHNPKLQVLCVICMLSGLLSLPFKQQYWYVGTQDTEISMPFCSDQTLPFHSVHQQVLSDGASILETNNKYCTTWEELQFFPRPAQINTLYTVWNQGKQWSPLSSGFHYTKCTHNPIRTAAPSKQMLTLGTGAAGSQHAQPCVLTQVKTQPHALFSVQRPHTTKQSFVQSLPISSGKFTNQILRNPL